MAMVVPSDRGCSHNPSSSWMAPSYLTGLPAPMGKKGSACLLPVPAVIDAAVNRRSPTHNSFRPMLQGGNSFPAPACPCVQPVQMPTDLWTRTILGRYRRSS